MMIKTVKRALADLDAARKDSLEESRLDIDRSDGSGAQEQRREDHKRMLRDRVYQCERELEEANLNNAMVVAFENEYKRSWDDPAGDDIKRVWLSAWTAAKAN